MINYGARELAASFRTVRGNTIQIAEDIPEEKYSFAAAEGTRSVAALLTHIAMIPRFQLEIHRDTSVTTLEGYDFAKLMGARIAEEKQERSKAEIIGLLKVEGEAFGSWLETLTPEFLNQTFTDPTGQNPRTRFESIMAVKEHEMHHRGQLMLIERMLGIVPHLTRAMMERFAARAAATAAAASSSAAS